jgi:sugar lactone lactonase YvrE
MKIQRTTSPFISFALALAIIIFLDPGHIFAEDFKAWVYTKLPDTPEGLCVDSKGNLYASLVHTGQVVKLENDGNFTHVAWVPSEKDKGKGAVYGMDTDSEDNIYIAYFEHSKYSNLFDPFHTDCRDATVTKSGVYKIDAKTREVTAVATRADGWPFCFPDDVDIDNAGNIYLTDLTYAGIWKITPDGKVVMWSNHPLLNWQSNPYSGAPLGVNVLVLDKEQKNIYAATDGDPMVLRIPIKEDGSAGDPVVIARGHSPFDGIEIDDEGYIYLSEILRNEIMILAPMEHPFGVPPRIIIANIFNAPLDSNTSLVLRDGVLYTANLGFTHPKWQDADKTVVAIKGFQKPILKK